MLSFISAARDTRDEATRKFLHEALSCKGKFHTLLLFAIVATCTICRVKLISSNNRFYSSSPSVGVYSDSDGEQIFLLHGQQGGVTHVMFSPDRTKLYSGGRKVQLNLHEPL